VRDRLLLVFPLLCLAFYLAVWVHWLLTTYNPRGDYPLGQDFSYCWTAATLALQGEPGAVYDYPRLAALERAHFGVNALLPWLYPPTYLLLLLPFGLLPYNAALALWLGATLSGYLFLIRRLAPHPRTIWLALAFPGIFMNLFYGQNGFLSGIFLGGGLLLLDRSPWAAGLLLALLTYKPHLAVLVPVALVAGRRWRVLLAMSAWTAALILTATLALGTQPWAAFISHLFTAVKTLEAGGLKIFTIMSSVFSAVLLRGGGAAGAGLLQGAAMLLAASMVIRVWRRGAAPPIGNATLVLGILLFVPYSFVYDLALLALPLAWLGWEGSTRGWLPGEKTCLSLAWLTPLVAPLLAQAAAVQISPLSIGVLLCLALRRAGRYPPKDKKMGDFQVTSGVKTGCSPGRNKPDANPFLPG
jgi:hypothetical protein